MIPKLYFMIGLPGSGKSTILENMSYAENIVIHSSDAIREELFGDVNEQGQNEKVFNTLHKRIKEDLLAGKTVGYDSTGIKKKNRIHFLKQLRDIPCEKKCVCVMTPYNDCLSYNMVRDRYVPEEVIKRMYESWQPPEYSEGWNSISFVFNFSSNSLKNKYSIKELFEGANGLVGYDQRNFHHTATLGNHCIKARDYVREHYPDTPCLEIAALLHDIGKVSTATPYTAKGNIDGEWHYYNHHCTGAYESLFYLNKLGKSSTEMVFISNLIYYHMHPYTTWAQSQKAECRDKELLGLDFVRAVWQLHEADVKAH